MIRSGWLAVTGIVALAVLIAIFWPAPEPVVKGEPMSWWLSTGTGHFPDAYMEAVAEMDERSVKYLIQQLEWHPPTTLDYQVNRLCRQILGHGILNEDVPDLRARAAETLGLMGERAVRAIPALRISATSPGTNQLDYRAQAAAIGALVLLKAESPDQLVKRILDGGNTNWMAYAVATLYVHTNMASSVPGLVEAYRTISDENVRGRIATLLRFIRSHPELTVPVLTELLRHPDPSVGFNAAIGLSYFGADARAALPTLTNLLSHTNSLMQSVAERAIGRIAPLAAKEAEGGTAKPGP